MDQTMKSTDDKRVNASGIRNKYRELSLDERNTVDNVKDLGQQLWDLIDSIPQNRDGTGRSVALAKTKLEEAVMWAVHAVTSPEPEREHKG
jgi:hypothetical protein